MYRHVQYTNNLDCTGGHDKLSTYKWSPFVHFTCLFVISYSVHYTNSAIHTIHFSGMEPMSKMQLTESLFVALEESRVLIIAQKV